MKSTEEIAIDFAQRANNAINKQLGIELKRLGILGLVQSKQALLKRECAISKQDDRFINEVYIAEIKDGKGSYKRMVMAVNWTPNSYSIERYAEETANAIKTDPKFRIKKDSQVDFAAMSQFDIEVEALAAKKMAQWKKGK